MSSATCGASSWGQSHLGLRRHPNVPAWAASTAASGLRIRTATWSASTAPIPAPPEDSSKYYFHFDSWRMNVQPGIWLPVAVYVEETQRTEGEKTVGLKAQTHFWGYSLKLPTRDSENVSVKVDDAVDKSDDSQDVGPLQASRMWITQAENNVIDRLVEAGLVAPLNSGRLRGQGPRPDRDQSGRTQ